MQTLLGQLAVSARWLVLLSVGLIMGLLPPTAANAANAARSEPSVVALLELTGPITPASADYLQRGLRWARENNASLVVLQLDTPGGLDTSMRDMIREILASPIPVAGFVAPEGARAASAGTYILYATHVAAMAPATTIGAATPVQIGGPVTPVPDDVPSRTTPDSPEAEHAPGPPPADAMKAKQINDAAAYLRGLAQLRGRNADWAERAVRDADAIAASEALAIGAIDIVAADVDSLLVEIDGRRVMTADGERVLQLAGARIEAVRPDWRNQLLAVLANPQLALILMMLGVYGLIFEFTSPGFGLPGIAGAICLLLGLFALQTLPINFAGLALIGLGAALLVGEIFVGGFGALGIGGALAIVLGGLLLFDRDSPETRVPLAIISSLAMVGLAVSLLAGWLARRAHRAPVASGADELKGMEGIVIDCHGDDGYALVHGERWRVRADRPLQQGQHVRVDAIYGLTLHVSPSPVKN